ncbi:MAG: SAM-dependent methyltransferase, partial [Clostridiales bacterium]|nr:SAM-dependent methyltransferase [Clostridiales bacterium]
MNSKHTVTIRTTAENANEIINNSYHEEIPDLLWSEAQIDSFVADEILKKRLFSSKVIFQQKTPNQGVNSAMPSKTSRSGSGEIDIMIFNYFSNGNIDLIIEDKTPAYSADIASEEAIKYADGGKAYQSRVAIGYNGKTTVLKIRVDGKWEPLYINGKRIDAFIGHHILEMIYKYPDNNIFILDASQFSQRDFHRILESLRTYYRNIPGLLADSDSMRIDFTVAFIALKLITEKEIIKYKGSSYGWEKLCKSADIEAAVDAINGNAAYEKYRDVFTIKDVKKSNAPVFDFKAIIADMDSDTIYELHKKISLIPQMHALPIDLFGEVYEVLANKKTKKALGEFFTRRHIIRPLLNIFLSDADVENIVRAYDSKKPLSIVDPFCGTGGFLTEFFKILKQRVSYDCKVDLVELAQKSFFGYDINPSNTTRTRINMYLAGDGLSEAERRDSLALSSTDVLKGLDVDISEKFDFVVTNVPYGAGKVAIEPKTTGSKRMEANALIKVIKLLKPTGKALVIIPDGVLEAPTLAPVRKYLVTQCRIDFICSLPKFAFAPYTKEKTYAVAFTKRKAPFRDIDHAYLCAERFWAYIIDNDGYANSDKRFETGLKDKNGRWLHNELSVWHDENGTEHPSLIEEKFVIGEQQGSEKYGDEWDNDIPGKKYGYISLAEVLKDVSISYERIKKYKTAFSDFSRASRELTEDEKLLLLGASERKQLFDSNGLKEEYTELLDIMD